MTPSQIAAIAASGTVDQVIGSLCISAGSIGLMMIFHCRNIRKIERAQRRTQNRREIMHRLQLRQTPK